MLLMKISGSPSLSMVRLSLLKYQLEKDVGLYNLPTGILFVILCPTLVLFTI